MRQLSAIVAVVILTQTMAGKPLPRRDRDEPPLSESRVVMETTLGRIVLELYPDKAPITVKNFLHYVDDRHYDGTVFHRVIPDFMIQGGGHMPGLKEKPTREPIKYEAANGLPNERGTIALARKADPDSGANQFFINLKHNQYLDHTPGKPGYCVFGKVVEGMDVVDKIRAVPTGQQGSHANVPLQDVIIRSVRRAPR